MRFTLNVRSLQKNIEQFHYFVSELNNRPEIITISETKLRKDHIQMNIELERYEFIHVDSELNAGGVGLYISNNLDFEMSNDQTTDLNSAESLWAKIKSHDQTIVIGVIYRHPIVSSTTISQFENEMFNIFDFFDNKKTEFYILRDTNIDFSKLYSNNYVRSYANNLINNSLKCLIDKPTTVTASSKSLINHIYTNYLQSSPYNGIILNDLSDHYSVFLFIPTKKSE